MTSFYGERKSDSFIIAKRFETVYDMDNFFSTNTNLSEVGYGQYVIIDTVLKSHQDNGKIYRRGFEGAEYIGQVVGPQGPMPSIMIVPFKDINIDANNRLQAEGSLKINAELYPGLPLGNGEDLNQILYRWENVQDDNENIKGFKFGVKAPYHTFHFALNPNNWWEQTELCENDALNSSYYHDYLLKLPKGIPGTRVEGISKQDNDDGTVTLKLNIKEPNGQKFIDSQAEEFITPNVLPEVTINNFNVNTDIQKILVISNSEPTNLKLGGLWLISEPSKSME